MSDKSDIPTLTDLIDDGVEIKISDLGLDEELDIRADDPNIDDTGIDLTEPDLGAIDPFTDNPALEQTIRRILDEHMELAWQEIKLAIQRDLNKP
ncbi:MAG: hypothetical protein GY807_12725 [Gammaproteobacteria bacterium]|nr:hypothetical protein [Gammaproteobacteria bacterium]